MLKLTIPEREYFDSYTQTFVNTKAQTLQLEHSLVSLSKWESKWHKPFISDEPKTVEETVDYIRCMTITQNVDPMVYQAITNDMLEEIQTYIDDPMTATWFSNNGPKKGVNKKSVITAEIIYYWMIANNIPMECQKWHLNRLLTLIRVCNEKNSPPKKMSKKEVLAQQKALNEARRAKLNTRG